MRVPAPLLWLVVLLAVLGSSKKECAAQIIFNGIDPGQIPSQSIDPKPLRRVPIEKATKPAKPYLPIPHFSNRNILQDRIVLDPPTQPLIRRDHIRPDHITWNVITRENIAPQRLPAKPLVPAMSPGQRMTLEATPSRPQWSFDQTLRGNAPPSERFDSSIHLAVPNYDLHARSPVLEERRQETEAFRPTFPTHPMSW